MSKGSGAPGHSSPIHCLLTESGSLRKLNTENVDAVSFTGRRVFHEVTLASGTTMLNERLAGFDFDLTPAGTRPFVAIPYVAIHVNRLLPQKVMRRDSGKFSAGTILRQIASEQIERGDIEHRSDRCQTLVRENWHFRALRGHQMRNRSPSRRRWKHRGLKPG
jgi:hypothetical protein